MSVVARIYDTQGLLAPLILKFKNNLRNLIKVQPSWTESIPLNHREVWINNFKTIKDLRDLIYIRCTIPSDAVRPTARLLHLTDAAICVMLGTYVCYPKANQTWSCDLLFGKGLLVPDNMKLPDMELHGLATGTHVRSISQM